MANQFLHLVYFTFIYIYIYKEEVERGFRWGVIQVLVILQFHMVGTIWAILQPLFSSSYSQKNTNFLSFFVSSNGDFGTQQGLLNVFLKTKVIGLLPILIIKSQHEYCTTITTENSLTNHWKLISKSTFLL